MSEIVLSTEMPSAQQFVQLRALMGWGDITAEAAATSLENTLAFAGLKQSDKLLAMGRVVGDGALYFYLQDIAVHPDHRGRGYGRAIMLGLERYLEQTAKAGASVALLAAAGKEGFYQRFGYQCRTGEPLGLGMCKFIK